MAKFLLSIFAVLQYASAVAADLMADSPVFEKGGKYPKPAKYPPDRRAETTARPEKGYVIRPSPRRSFDQIDDITKAMPAGRFTPPPHDWANLRRTKAALGDGGRLHIMAVGDSIVNDTMRSGWVAGLRRAYPKADIIATTYVRGGGGCQHYRENNRVAKYIVPRKPDLVLIGGISQRGIGDIKEVITQLRRGLPNVEILLTTGAFGRADPRDAAELARTRTSGTGGYGKKLKQLAREAGCAYLDMTTPWAEYMRSAGVHPHRFYRDPVHANEYGEQVLARILLAFFGRD